MTTEILKPPKDKQRRIEAVLYIIRINLFLKYWS